MYPTERWIKAPTFARLLRLGTCGATLGILASLAYTL